MQHYPKEVHERGYYNAFGEVVPDSKSITIRFCHNFSRTYQHLYDLTVYEIMGMIIKTWREYCGVGNNGLQPGNAMDDYSLLGFDFDPLTGLVTPEDD